MGGTMTLDEGDQSGPVAAFSPGTSIAHFRIVKELGRGGMGIVLEAHDPDLDRRVAIKVVREGSSSRLVREAQAMARLAHPNVVTVYEVGELAGTEMFVVMELVTGSTLGEWLKTERSWREIVIAFAAAADGLQAAHRAGLVHRDFKPSNVLVDHDGRVRVSDFGLAHSEDTLAEGSEPIAGTLAYMAPEQRAGRVVDARADQYSFGIALQDALAHKKPPRRVQKAIARALSIDPDDRWPAMASLAHELRKALPRRRVAMIGGALVLAAVALFLIVEPSRGAVVSCADGAQLVDQVWNVQAKATTLAQFQRAAPGIDTTHAIRLVDDWSSAWKLGRRAACTVDEPLRSARVGCLDRELAALSAQVGVWADALPAIVEQSASTAARLPNVDACALETTSTSIHPSVVSRVAQIEALTRSGQMSAALSEVPGLLTIARASGRPRDLATALTAAGKAEYEYGKYADAEAHFREAAQQAGEARDDVLLVDALVHEAGTKVEAGAPLDALGLLDAATAVGVRIGGDTREVIASTRGNALFEAGRIEEAIAVYRSIIPATEARAMRDPSSRIDLSNLFGQLASALRQSDDYEGAADLERKAIALDEQTFGPNHPEVAKGLADLTSTELHLEKLDDARAHIDRAKAIVASAYGTDAIVAAKISLVDAKLLDRVGKLDDAFAAYKLTLERLKGTPLPADHSLYVIVEEGFGEALQRGGHCDQALPHIERAIMLLERSRLDPRSHALQLTEAGHCYSETEQHDKARDALTKALVELDDAKADKRWKVEPFMMLAYVEHDTHHEDKAIQYARQALAAAEGDTTDEMKVMVETVKKQLARQWD
ncbi:MAG: serine/threonine-protein kinase [Kofleriaceae bacterium]